MRPKPCETRKTGASKHPPAEAAGKASLKVAKKCRLHANRIYARAAKLFIRTADLPSQAQLNDRERQLQDYLGSERVNRGDGSPLHRNPQQAFTFSATDRAPVNTVLDDFTGLVDPLPADERGEERGSESVMIPFRAPRTENAYQRMVDRSHRRMVQDLLGTPADADRATVMRLEQHLSAQGF